MKRLASVLMGVLATTALSAATWDFTVLLNPGHGQKTTTVTAITTKMTDGKKVELKCGGYIQVTSEDGKDLGTLSKNNLKLDPIAGKQINFKTGTLDRVDLDMTLTFASDKGPAVTLHFTPSNIRYVTWNQTNKSTFMPAYDPSKKMLTIKFPAD